MCKVDVVDGLVSPVLFPEVQPICLEPGTTGDLKLVKESVARVFTAKTSMQYI